MKIQFGTPLTSNHLYGTFFFGCVIVAIIWFNLHLQSLLAKSEKSIIKSRGLNVTHISSLLYCDLPYDDCLCSVLSNKSNISEKCITYVQLEGSRILPFISFFAQICLIRELFSLSGNYRRVIIYVLWIVSILIFVGIKIGIYWSACYHVYITAALYLTGASLCLLSFHNLTVGTDRMDSISNHNQVIVPHRSEATNNESRSWLELL
jgi:hypothetical protein